MSKSKQREARIGWKKKERVEKDGNEDSEIRQSEELT